jgi:hypothetical protein
MVDGFKEEADLSSYDWDTLKGFDVSHDDIDEFCLGEGQGSECTIPEPGETGPFSFKFEGKRVDRLFGLAMAADEYIFQLVTTGDDNPGDCSHDGFEITMGASLAIE